MYMYLCVYLSIPLGFSGSFKCDWGILGISGTCLLFSGMHDAYVSKGGQIREIKLSMDSGGHAHQYYDVCVFACNHGCMPACIYKILMPA